jgi:DNA-binding phage protein
MTASKIIKHLLHTSGSSKAKLCRDANVSTNTLDEAMKGGDVLLQTLMRLLKASGQEMVIVPKGAKVQIISEVFRIEEK